MAYRIQQRRDTAARWAEMNPILLDGEMGLVTDNPNQYKIGDGVHTWNELPLRGYTGTIAQTLGNNENAVASQKVVTEKFTEQDKKLSDIGSEVGIIYHGSPQIDSTILDNSKIKGGDIITVIATTEGERRIKFFDESDNLIGTLAFIDAGEHNYKYVVPYGFSYAKTANGRFLALAITSEKMNDNILNIAKQNRGTFLTFQAGVGAYLNVDELGNVTAQGGIIDMYFANGKYIRYNSKDILFTLSKMSGLGIVYYDLNSNAFITNPSDWKDGYVFVAVRKLGKISLFGDVPIQYSDGTKTDSIEMISTNLQKSMNLSAVCYGKLSVDLVTGEVKVKDKNFDIYYGVGGKFKRYSVNTVLCTISKESGTNVMLYTEGVGISYGSSNDGSVIAVCFGKKVFPIGCVEVEYSNGVTMSNPYDLSYSQTNGVPEYIDNEASLTFQRFIDWCGVDKTFVAGLITDVHGYYQHVGYLDKLSNCFGCNCLVNGGDIGLDLLGVDKDENDNVNYDVSYQLVRKTKSNMSLSNDWIFCKGNHERLIDSGVFGNIFNSPLKRRNYNAFYGDDTGCYGYIDYDYNSLRLIWLNTSDANIKTHYGMTKKQLDWFVNTLLSTPNEYNIIVFGHLCVDDCGRMASEQSFWNTEWSNCLMSIMQDFNAHQDGYNDDVDVTWDFNGKLNKIISYISGDSHFNNHAKTNGVNYVVRQGYGQGGMTGLPSGATKDELNPNISCSIDIVSVKEGMLKIFRIGVGGSSRDLEISI